MALIDSGATRTCCGRREFVRDIEAFQTALQFGNDMSIKCNRKCTLDVTVPLIDTVDDEQCTGHLEILLRSACGN